MPIFMHRDMTESGVSKRLKFSLAHFLDQKLCDGEFIGLSQVELSLCIIDDLGNVDSVTVTWDNANAFDQWQFKEGEE